MRVRERQGQQEGGGNEQPQLSERIKGMVGEERGRW
jgi:hypothetical protein